MRISWSTKLTNERVVKMSGQKLSLIRLRQLKFFCHVMRKREVEHLAITGEVLGKKAKRRDKVNYLKQIPNNAIDLIRTDNRKGWQLYLSVAANVLIHRPGKGKRALLEL